MMKITRNVILDLLPMYLANEVSADTRSMIEEYLETDPELANVVKHSTKTEWPGDIPVPLTQDDGMRAYKKARHIIKMHTLILAGLISAILIIIIYAFLFSSP